VCPLGRSLVPIVVTICVTSFLYNVGQSTFDGFFSVYLKSTYQARNPAGIWTNRYVCHSRIFGSSFTVCSAGVGGEDWAPADIPGWGIVWRLHVGIRTSGASPWSGAHLFAGSLPCCIRCASPPTRSTPPTVRRPNASYGCGDV
jgi:hypothetical protein